MSSRRRIKNELYYGYSRLGDEAHQHLDRSARIAVRASEKISKAYDSHQAKSHVYVGGKISNAKARVKGLAMRIISPFSETVVGPPKKKKGRKK